MGNIKIPRYSSGRVQEIIKNKKLSPVEKADLIYRFDEHILKRKGGSGIATMRPMYNKDEIKDALIELER